jgi:hypothetical protein
VKDIRYQEQCAYCDCDIWIKDGVRHLICPHCGFKLNEYSSEDADDGIFSLASELRSIKIGDTIVFNTGERRKVLAFTKCNGFNCLIVDRELGEQSDICYFKLSDGKHPRLADCPLWIVKVIAKEEIYNGN